jgi:hypothetical protein
VDKDDDAADDDDDEDAEPEDMTPIENLKYHVGGRQRPQTLADLERAFHGNVKFDRFRLRLSAFLNSFFQIHNIPLPNGKHIKLAAESKVRIICTSPCFRFTHSNNATGLLNIGSLRSTMNPRSTGDKLQTTYVVVHVFINIPEMIAF